MRNGLEAISKGDRRRGRGGYIIRMRRGENVWEKKMRGLTEEVRKVANLNGRLIG